MYADFRLPGWPFGPAEEGFWKKIQIAFLMRSDSAMFTRASSMMISKYIYLLIFEWLTLYTPTNLSAFLIWSQTKVLHQKLTLCKNFFFLDQIEKALTLVGCKVSINLLFITYLTKEISLSLWCRFFLTENKNNIINHNIIQSGQTPN